MQTTTPDLVKAVAMEYKGELPFGISRADPEFQKQFNISKAPAVMMLQVLFCFSISESGFHKGWFAREPLASPMQEEEQR